MTSPAERRVHEGRTLLSRTDDDTRETVEGWPEIAYEAVRAINHLTFGGAIPAPVVYDVLGNLKGVGSMLPQALQQLAAGLEQSLTEFNVYDHKGDPSESVATARTHLEEAARLASQLGDQLEAAQVAINSQGYEPD